MDTAALPLLDLGLSDMAVRDLVVAHPGATAILRRFKIDYCRGGAASLATAAEAGGVDLPSLVEAIAALEPTSQAAPSETGALIDHLVERYHDVHRRQFPEAIQLASRVEAVHPDHPAAPWGLSQHLAFMLDDLEQHQQKEELMLFPMMRKGSYILAKAGRTDR